jgi:hypothetical protein
MGVDVANTVVSTVLGSLDPSSPDLLAATPMKREGHGSGRTGGGWEDGP